MKKLFAILMTIAVAGLVLSGCAKEETTETPKDTTTGGDAPADKTGE